MFVTILAVQAIRHFLLFIRSWTQQKMVKTSDIVPLRPGIELCLIISTMLMTVLAKAVKLHTVKMSQRKIVA